MQIFELLFQSCPKCNRFFILLGVPAKLLIFYPNIPDGSLLLYIIALIIQYVSCASLYFNLCFLYFHDPEIKTGLGVFAYGQNLTVITSHHRPGAAENVSQERIQEVNNPITLWKQEKDLHRTRTPPALLSLAT